MAKKIPVTEEELEELFQAWQDAYQLAEKFIDDMQSPSRSGGWWLATDIYRAWKDIENEVPTYKRRSAYRRWYRKEIAKIQALIELRPNWDEIVEEREKQEAEAPAIRAANLERYAAIIAILDQLPGPFCQDMVAILETTTKTQLTDIFTERQLEVIVEIWGKHRNTEEQHRIHSDEYRQAVSEFHRRYTNQSQ